jgi:LacI family transcriptional regulator
MENKQKPGGKAPATVPERPTLKTIAFMTGLGVTTVSRALKDAPDIGAETKERVRMVASQLGYQPNRAGVRLRTGKTSSSCRIRTARTRWFRCATSSTPARPMV